MAHVAPVRHRDNVAVEQIALVLPFQKTGADTDAVFPRQPQQLQCGRPVGNRLGKYIQFRPRQVAQKTNTRSRTSPGRPQLRALPRRLGGKPPHLGQVDLLVARPMLELNRGNFVSFIVIIPAFIQRRGKRADAVSTSRRATVISGRPMSGKGRTSSRPSAWPSDAIAETWPGALPSRKSIDAGGGSALGLENQSPGNAATGIADAAKASCPTWLTAISCFKQVIHVDSQPSCLPGFGWSISGSPGRFRR